MTDRTESERLKILLAGHYQKGRQEMREEIHNKMAKIFSSTINYEELATLFYKLMQELNGEKK